MTGQRPQRTLTANEPGAGQISTSQTGQTITYLGLDRPDTRPSSSCPTSPTTPVTSAPNSSPTASNKPPPMPGPSLAPPCAPPPAGQDPSIDAGHRARRLYALRADRTAEAP
jgi:hypothetical protein